ncbi:MAG TPA: N-acetylmuramoyl-L-alanine amidase-like domain-containing protein [Longimicrobiaceae bacterium]|nr:N-acetylmuramoyl-L-alanine amidase-like domain-containing protein [Longimicrobiaceae bacterium]
MPDPISRRSLFRYAALSAGLMMSDRLAAAPLIRSTAPETDRERLARWLRTLRSEGLGDPSGPAGRAVARAAELALGTPYKAYTLEQYLVDGGDPRREPLTLHLDVFDCVSLVESAIAAARTAAKGVRAGWEDFAGEMERMRYRDGVRNGYASRLHYFSEWIADGARRGLLRDLGPELSADEDRRPLRFMTEHRGSYPALRDDATFAAIGAMERALDDSPRHVIPTARIPEVQDRIQSGDVLAFATSIAGLDVTHTGLAHRDGGGVLRVLHAPLSGGAVEVSRSTLPEYVAAIRRSTGILVARPLRA